LLSVHPHLVKVIVNSGQEWVATHSAQEIAEVVAPSFPDTDVALLTTVAQRYVAIDAWSQTPVLEKQTFDF